MAKPLRSAAFAFYNPHMAASLPSFPEAARVVYDYAAKLAPTPRTERLPLDAASGHVLAQPILADRDMPAFPRSTRDGFAVRAAEASAHKWLPVAGSIRAGDPPAGPLPAHSAWEIMTGAAVPEGADAVAMLEHVEHDGNQIRLTHGRKLDSGENVVPAAAEARAGDQLVPTGTRLGPSHIAAAAHLRLRPPRRLPPPPRRHPHHRRRARPRRRRPRPRPRSQLQRLHARRPRHPGRRRLPHAPPRRERQLHEAIPNPPSASPSGPTCSLNLWRRLRRNKFDLVEP